MSTLPEVQAGFVTAILQDDVAGVAGAVQADGLAPEARVQLYRNHVLSSLTEALAATFPVVCRLVDRRFFGYAADAYIRRHPPGGPCLFEYGATLPQFLASFPACADDPYLPDVARLEWAMNATLHAAERPPVDRVALAAILADDIGRLTLRLDPGAAWLRSDWPVDGIWRANQPDFDPEATVDLSEGGARLEIRRQSDVVTLRRLDAALFGFRAALGQGEALEVAAEAALAQDPDFDLTTELRALLDEALVVGIMLDPAPGDG
jgi:Putative DNA-binding domain